MVWCSAGPRDRHRRSDDQIRGVGQAPQHLCQLLMRDALPDQLPFEPPNSALHVSPARTTGRSQICGEDLPRDPTIPDNQRAIDPRPAPTSQQRQPTRTPAFISAFWLGTSNPAPGQQDVLAPVRGPRRRRSGDPTSAKTNSTPDFCLGSVAPGRSYTREIESTTRPPEAVLVPILANRTTGAPALPA